MEIIPIEEPSARTLELVQEFLKLPNPQEHRESPPRELFHFPNDIPHLHRILKDYYADEDWIRERDENWVAPYYAWRALGLAQDPSSVPVLIDCLELCDPGEDIDEFFEFGPLLATFGVTLIEETEKRFSDGLLRPDEAYTAGLLVDGMRLLSAKYPELRPRFLTILRRRLERFRLNAPLLNAILVGELARNSDRDSLPLILSVYSEDFCDISYFPWDELREHFPDLSATPPEAEIADEFVQTPYIGDAEFSDALQAAGLEGRLMDRKAFLLGVVLSPQALLPGEFSSIFFYCPYTDREAQWGSGGQELFLQTQYLKFWNEMAAYQEHRFPLEGFLRMDPILELPSGLSIGLCTFVREFEAGLELDASPRVKGWLREESFLRTLFAETERLEEALEARGQADVDSLTRKILDHWNNGYLAFAKKAQACRVLELERAITVEQGRHLSRNDPCPCGSGKKFKKCCLQ